MQRGLFWTTFATVFLAALLAYLAFAGGRP